MAVLLSSWSVVTWTAGDPRGQQVVGVLDKVVSDEHVEEFGVAAQVSGGEHDELSFSRSRREAGGALEQGRVSREERGGDEQRSGGRGRGSSDDLVGGAGVASDEAVQERGFVCGHETKVRPGPDGVLTVR
jgi:hypothetical protein